MSKNDFLELKIPPPVVFLLFAGLMWLLSKAVPGAALEFPLKLWIALIFAAASFLFAGGSILLFLRAGTTLHPHHPGRTTRLVVTGVNAVTRNPMYLSLLFLLIGWAVYLSNIAVFVPIPFFVAYLNRFQIRPEERALASRFGAEFEEYCKRVRRWL